MSRTEVTEVLASFEDDFAEFATAFSRGEYLLWLGSGISRDVVPGLQALLKQMLEFLRRNVDESDPACRYQRALDDVLDVAGVPETDRTGIDIDLPTEEWRSIDAIVGRMIDKYSDVLDVQVQGESEDFLVWRGLDIPGTYGAGDLEPDIEHFCVAILMLEGVVRSAPSTNWDGLIEEAMNRLTGEAERFLNVRVTPDDFRLQDRQAELVKFHGCAIRAAAWQDEYRSRLIARKSQIVGWPTRAANKMMKDHLEHMFASKSAFIVGLSAQDPNIQLMLHEATEKLGRTWPTTPVAVVFAEESLHHHHTQVLRATYRDTYSENAEAIRKSALLGAYAKPALIALVLFSLTEKMCELIRCTTGLSLPPEEAERVCADIRTFRDEIGKLADEDPKKFVVDLVSGIGLILSVFRTGHPPEPTGLGYEPISTSPVARSLDDPNFPGAAFGRLAIAIALLGRGLSEGRWNLVLGKPEALQDGVVRIVGEHQVSRLFVVLDSRALSRLEIDGIVDLDEEDVLVVQAEAARLRATRSPKVRYGRTGTSGARVVDLEDLCATVDRADELIEAFCHEGAI